MNSEAKSNQLMQPNEDLIVGLKEDVLPRQLQSLILNSMNDPNMCRFGVREILERAYEYDFANQDLVTEAGEAARGLVHSVLNALPAQIDNRKHQLERILGLDKSLSVIRRADAAGFRTKLFGELDKRMHRDLQMGHTVSFSGQSSGYYWIIEMAGKSETPIPTWALENLTRFRMAGAEFDQVLLGHEVEVRPIRYVETAHYPDPVLLVLIKPLFLIEVARWV